MRSEYLKRITGNNAKRVYAAIAASEASVISEKILQWYSHKALHVFKELHLREELIRHFFSRLVRVERNKLLRHVYLLVHYGLGLITSGL